MTTRAQARLAPPNPLVAEIAAQMVRMQRQLFDAGLLETARAVNEASRKLGWEQASLLERQR